MACHPVSVIGLCLCGSMQVGEHDLSLLLCMLAGSLHVGLKEKGHEFLVCNAGWQGP